jgi:hypothetical protein
MSTAQDLYQMLAEIDDIVQYYQQRILTAERRLSELHQERDTVIRAIDKHCACRPNRWRVA